MNQHTETPPADELLPAKFADANGQEWPVAITYADRLRVLKRTGVDVTKLIDPETEDFKKLSKDPAVFFDVLVGLLEPLLVERGLSPDDLAHAINNESVADAAGEAVMDAVINFTPPQKRGILAEAMTRTITISRSMEAEQVKKAREAITNGTLDREIQKALRESGKPD